jgi:uncharacterized phage-associated protein
MPYFSLAIANEFIKVAGESGQTLTPMKLQKLVYFAHGWCLALTGKPLINEPIEAWKFGPVIPSLYHSVKQYGNQPIDSPVLPEYAFSAMKPPSIDDGPDVEENTFAKQLVRRIWDVYGRFTPFQLSNLTHAQDSPWDKTEKGQKKQSINSDLIRDYFKSQIKREVNG